jgi:hypothetical protein
MKPIPMISLTVFAMLSFLFGCGEDKKVMDDQFAVGQVWQYDTREGESESVLTIVKLDQADSLGPIIHVHIQGLRIKSPTAPSGFSDVIHHMPFSKDAVVKSVTEKVGQVKELPDFMEGYHQWHEAFTAGKGGFFTTPVKEAITYVEQGLNQ